MSPAPGPVCPRCGAPLTVPTAGLVVQCPYCGGQTAAGAGERLRQLLLVDTTPQEEAAALLAQHLRERFPGPTAVLGGGELLLAPVWSVIRADGELVAGPATREESLLTRLQLPSLPARPLADAEQLPGLPLGVDVSLEAFLHNAQPTATHTPHSPASDSVATSGETLAHDGIHGDTEPARVWLAWVPVRAWQVRVGRGVYRALSVADSATPLLETVRPTDANPPLVWRRLLPLLGYTSLVGALALLLPLVFYLPVAAAALALGLWVLPAPSAAWPQPMTAPATDSVARTGGSTHGERP